MACAYMLNRAVKPIFVNGENGMSPETRYEVPILTKSGSTEIIRVSGDVFFNMPKQFILRGFEKLLSG